MITTLSNSPRVPHLLNIANTAFNVLVEADARISKVVEALSISCLDTATDVTIVITKSGVDYILWNEVTIQPKKKPEMLTDGYPFHIRLDGTMKIRVKASIANQITAIAFTLDATPTQSTGGYGGSVAGGY